MSLKQRSRSMLSLSTSLLSPCIIIQCINNTKSINTSNTELMIDIVCRGLENRGFKMEEAVVANDSFTILVTLTSRLYQKLILQEGKRELIQQSSLSSLSHKQRYEYAQQSLHIINRAILINFNIDNDNNDNDNRNESKSNDIKIHCNNLKWSTWIAHDIDNHNNKYTTSIITNDNSSNSNSNNDVTVFDYYGYDYGMFISLLSQIRRNLIYILLMIIFTFCYCYIEPINNEHHQHHHHYHWYDFINAIIFPSKDSSVIPILILTEFMWSTVIHTKLKQVYLLEHDQHNNASSNDSNSSSSSSSNSSNSSSDSDRKSSIFKVARMILSSSIILLAAVAFSTVTISLSSSLLSSPSLPVLLPSLTQKSVTIVSHVTRYISINDKLIHRLLLVLVLLLMKPLVPIVVSISSYIDSNDDSSVASSLSTIKSFILQSAVCYSPFLYLGFWKTEYKEVQQLLLIYLVTIVVIKKLTRLSLQFSVYKIDIDTVTCEEIIKRESSLSSQSSNQCIHEDFLELLLFAGFLNFFTFFNPTVAFLILVDATINNKIVDDSNRRRYQLVSDVRFKHFNTRTFLHCLHCMSFLSIVANSCFLWRSQNNVLNELFESVFVFNNTDVNRIIQIVIFEHIMVLFKLVYSFYFGVSLNHHHDDSHENSSSSKRFSLQNKSEQSTKKIGSIGTNGSMGTNSTNGYGNGHILDSIKKAVGPSDKLVNIREDPLLLVVAFVSAPILHKIGFSLWTYLPVVILITTYFQLAKEKKIKNKALNLAVDPQIIKHLLSSFPSWIHDSEAERCEFLNKTFEKLWPCLGKAIGNITAGVVNPILESVRPNILEQMELTTMEFGTNAPKIVSVKYVNSSSNHVRLDCDVRWASDLVASLAVGVKNLPLLIQLTELMFTSCVSIQLINPTHRGIIPFEVLSISLINNPVIDFSLKIANLDVLNIGILDFNVDSLVKSIIKDILGNLLVAPNRLLVPMYPLDEENLSLINNPSPAGLLVVNIEKAEGIVAGDIWGTSDPYLTLKSATGLVTTSTIYRTLNPVWNEQVEILIKDKESETIIIDLYDHDLVAADAVIGKTLINVKDLEDGENMKMVLVLKHPLTDYAAGKLFLSACYVPFVDDEDDTHTASIPTGSTNQQIDTTDYLAPDDGSHNDIDRENFTPMSSPSIRRRLLGSISSDLWSNPGEIEGLSEGLTVGLLQISRMKCKNIKVEMHKGIILKRPKKLTPYLVISVKNNDTGRVTYTRETKPAQKGFVNPVYDESFPIIVHDPNKDVLEIRVMSGRKNLLQDEFFLGRVTIPISSLINDIEGKSVITEREYILYDGILMKEQRFFSCKLNWRLATTKIRG